MRIISDFKDFYDCMMAHDTDRTTLYIRNPASENIDVKKFPFPACSDTHEFSNHKRVTNDLHVVGFCGKVYPIVHMEYRDNNSFQTTFAYCRGIEQVDSFFKSILSKTDFEEYMNPPKAMGNTRRYGRYSWYGGSSKYTRRANFVAFFEEYKKKRNSFEKMFEASKCPIFLASMYCNRTEYTMTYNANLKPVEFFRIFNPQQAYQELTMYMYNMAVPEKPIPQMDDKTKAESKGFNKFSFRKDAIKKR